MTQGNWESSPFNTPITLPAASSLTSSPLSVLIPALDRLKEEGLLQELHEKICIGQGYRGKSGALGVGSCTSGFKYNLKGCPPTDEQMYEFLKQYIATRRKTEAEK